VIIAWMIGAVGAVTMIASPMAAPSPPSV